MNEKILNQLDPEIQQYIRDLQTENAHIKAEYQGYKDVVANDLRTIIQEAVQYEISKAQEVAMEEISFRDKLMGYYHDFKEPIDKYISTSKEKIGEMFKGIKDNSRLFVEDNAKWWELTSEEISKSLKNFGAELGNFALETTEDTLYAFTGLSIEEYQKKCDNFIADTREKLIDAKETLVNDLKHEKWKFNQKTEPFINMVKENIAESRDNLTHFKEKMGDFLSNTKGRINDFFNRNKPQEINLESVYQKVNTNSYSNLSDENMRSAKEYGNAVALTLKHECSSQIDSRIQEDCLIKRGTVDYIRSNYPFAYEKLSGDIAKFNFDKSVSVDITAYMNNRTGVECIGVAVSMENGAKMNTIYDIRSMEVTDILYQRNETQEPREVFCADAGFVNHNLLANGFSAELITKYDKASQTIREARENQLSDMDKTIDHDKNVDTVSLVQDNK